MYPETSISSSSLASEPLCLKFSKPSPSDAGCMTIGVTVIYG
ncbi:hypothetical protein DJ66_0150 [Candidatus Liberibacter solanacearum]|uniref:Uncharacterized protein n=1 Tax=Candidatus Liberibacter solanacearum TaxID=556287 RepID=A0A0F4VPD5_9HYPH|nr:hypothetical protein [Candidatus Liberibacter solanacearum]KJZ82542.1 hypothetical protein DJ66_0150 [Candidatus Liberibacter solanacearum]